MIGELPYVGQTVHYVSYGTPGGEYPPTCRAAIITEVGQWVRTKTTTTTLGRRTVEERWDDTAAALTVWNPTGLFFNGAGSVACPHLEPAGDTLPPGGSWHHLHPVADTPVTAQ